MDEDVDFMYTRNGQMIPKKNVLEVDKDGCVLSSAKVTIFDFNDKCPTSNIEEEEDDKLSGEQE